MDKSRLTPEDKQAAANTQLDVLATELSSISTTIKMLIENPGADRQHFYAEGVRLAALATDAATSRRDILIELAAREPERVSFPKLAALANVSVNTIRNKLGLNPGTDTKPKRDLDTPQF